MRNAACLVHLGLLALACGSPVGTAPQEGGREGSIPEGAVKVTPETDLFPPVLHSEAWEEPVPLSSAVNTAGVEDAPVVSDDGSTLYFFFTPDASAPAEEQLTDGYTGVWKVERTGSSWGTPQSVVLSDGLSLDGPVSLQEDTLWFVSVRSGTYGADGDVFRAWPSGGGWAWQNAGSQLNADYNAGECAVGAGGGLMVCARDAEFGVYGGYDLWQLEEDGGGWTEPVNLGGAVNGPDDDGWPALSADAGELWFTSSSSSGQPGPAVYRCSRAGGSWSKPEEIVSGFSGDPSVDSAGNLYFTHVYADSSGEVIETDIYVCIRR